MSDHFDRNEPYGELMERLSRGISTWNFNFGSPEAEFTPQGEISHHNEIFAPLAKSRRILLLPILVVALLVLMAGVKRNFWQDRKELSAGKGMENFELQKRPIRMAKIEPIVRDHTLEISVAVVEGKKLVSFEYEGDGGQIPLLAFQTSSGKIETAVGLSWPCRSKSFHIEGTEIVCDLCFTHWDLETLRGVSGECLDHPLNKITHTVQDGKLLIRGADIRNWKPQPVLG